MYTAPYGEEYSIGACVSPSWGIDVAYHMNHMGALAGSGLREAPFPTVISTIPMLLPSAPSLSVCNPFACYIHARKLAFSPSYVNRRTCIESYEAWSSYQSISYPNMYSLPMVCSSSPQRGHLVVSKSAELYPGGDYAFSLWRTLYQCSGWVETVGGCGVYVFQFSGVSSSHSMCL